MHWYKSDQNRGGPPLSAHAPKVPKGGRARTKTGPRPHLPGGTTFSFTVPQSYFAYGPKAGTLVSLTVETDTDHFPKAALNYTTGPRGARGVEGEGRSLCRPRHLWVACSVRSVCTLSKRALALFLIFAAPR